jgi:hypothetical protein
MSLQVHTCLCHFISSYKEHPGAAEAPSHRVFVAAQSLRMKVWEYPNVKEQWIPYTI